MTVESEIVERLPFAIILVDQEDRIIYLNSCAVELFGITGDAEAEKSYFDFFGAYLKNSGPLAVTNIKDDCKQAISDGQSWETILDGMDGKILHLRSFPFQGSQIEKSGSIFILEDITHYQTMVNEQLTQERLALVSRAAHQLNQPLQVILGYISLMLMDLGSEEPQHSFLHKMLDQIEEAQKITRELSNIMALR